jgi:transposase
MEEEFGLDNFLEEFSHDDACLEYIKNSRYPWRMFCVRCKRTGKLTKIKKRPVYQCSCGFQLSPLAGTIFHKSPTSLHLWFYALFLFVHTNGKVTAKQLQRELGVTYKTAWRIRQHLHSLAQRKRMKVLGQLAGVAYRKIRRKIGGIRWKFW